MFLSVYLLILIYTQQIVIAGFGEHFTYQLSSIYQDKFESYQLFLYNIYFDDKTQFLKLQVCCYRVQFLILARSTYNRVYLTRH